MPEAVRTAFTDLGHALKNRSIEEFYASDGWRIVKEPSAYTRNAFLSTFEDPACMKYWQKYLILPDKTPIPGPDVLRRLTMPVTVVACRNDLCHPYEYGSYLAGQIGGCTFVEIPDKDRDSAMHRQRINEIIREMFEGKEG